MCLHFLHRTYSFIGGFLNLPRRLFLSLILIPVPSLMKLGSPGDILDWLLDPIRIQLKADIDSGTENGWELLMSLDGMSTVEFLSKFVTTLTPPPLNILRSHVLTQRTATTTAHGP